VVGVCGARRDERQGEALPTRELRAVAEIARSAARVCRALAAQLKEDGQLAVVDKDDLTPVTLVDFVLQALISSALRREFPQDGFLAEESGATLADQPELRQRLLRYAQQYIDPQMDESALPALLDAREASSTQHGDAQRMHRTWVVDPLDGTRGFVSGKGFCIGIALIDSHGSAQLAGLAAARDDSHMSIYVAQRNVGCFELLPNAEQSRRVVLDRSKSSGFLQSDVSNASAWTLSLSAYAKQAGWCPLPFGSAINPPRRLCCGSLIKYAALLDGSVELFVQLDADVGRGERPGWKCWDHAAGVLCVEAAGGFVLDGEGGAIRFNHGKAQFSPPGLVLVAASSTCSVREVIANMHNSAAKG